MSGTEASLVPIAPKEDVLSLTAIVGTNGSGKTTYLKGLYAELKKAESDKRVVFLNDNPIIPIELPAQRLIESVGVIKGLQQQEARRRAIQLCSGLMIKDSSSMPVMHYSAGNYKKTALAITLIKRPDYLLMDEPLEAVDPISRSRIIKYFENMSKTSIYISTQDLELAMRAKEVLIFKDLKPIAQGKPGDILGNSPFQRFNELSGISNHAETFRWLT
ncbi:ATP-binding cassette domain-containing protein [Corynebacterium hindlerae]|uniref:ATP-binding cassette domain-containing protein n=1 Tax=Corynebacterium hindlerae TaxID=699041 RepID=UPI003AAD35D9